MTRPSPVLTEDNHSYWDAATEGRLICQRCGVCGRLQHPPRPICPRCHSTTQETAQLAGTGVVYSYAVLHHPKNPQFDYPVVAILVDLDEGIRVVSSLVDVPVSEIHIGMRVRVAFAPTADEMAVPVFKADGGKNDD